MPEAVPSSTEALPDGFAQVVRAAGLMPIIAATFLFTSFTICAPLRSTSSSNSTCGLFIQPVMLTPISASRSKISFDSGPRNSKSV
jgi:hypothetical protein